VTLAILPFDKRERIYTGMRIYISPESITKKNGIAVPPDKSRHLMTVMRCKYGDELTVIDGRGKAYLARISDIRKKTVMIDILSETIQDAESSVPIILCQGILKGDKMDLVIQKATELGISEIIPAISVRCQVKETRKTQRWRKLAEEAAEQCGRAVIPDVREPQPFAGIFEMPAIEHAAARLIFWEGGGMSLDEAMEKTAISSGISAGTTDITADVTTERAVVIFIGPEGGFASSEIEAVESRGIIRATLGKRILRAETAAIAAVTLVQFLAEKKASHNRKV
jgi:16S rRNA (uracil1498-N3)-methyltransferase